MTVTIALAGKGGTGKTTVAAMVIRYLLEEQGRSVLAIDADPSSNLNMVLGLELDETVGDIREELLAEIQSTMGVGALAGGLPNGMSKSDYFDYHIRMATVEGDGVDLIAMGRPEGQSCYCAWSTSVGAPPAMWISCSLSRILHNGASWRLNEWRNWWTSWRSA
jgi:CO dehydrogenase maturation factor